jgi:hypothetical protein
LNERLAGGLIEPFEFFIAEFLRQLYRRKPRLPKDFI